MSTWTAVERGPLSDNAVSVMEKRYLRKHDNGEFAESPLGMFKRVAWHIANGDKAYGVAQHDVEKTYAKFFDMLWNLEFLPNSPTFNNSNAGTGQLSACFVLPIYDDLASIFQTVKHTALIHQTGGGTGFSFSRLRPKDDLVRSTQGVSSGPVSFMRVVNAATEAIKQGGTRRGANMGILRVDHPNIVDFITAKENLEELKNFNISVAVTDVFMKAVDEGISYDLVNPRTGTVVGALDARTVFKEVVHKAWSSGEPGIVFIDRMNEYCPVPWLGDYEATNPCWTGDTMVWTLYGPKTFKELAEARQDVPVFSQDDAGNLVVKLMRKPRLTAHKVELVEVYLDNGHVLRCTPNHSFYLRDGKKVMAKDLKKRDSLGSLYRHKANSKGYQVLTNGQDKPLEHHLVASWEYGRRPSYPREHCHHIDGNKLNNSPDNLEIVEARKHNSEHMLGENNPMYGVWDQRNPLFGKPTQGKSNGRYRPELDELILKLHKEGKGPRAIAAQLSCTKNTVERRLGIGRFKAGNCDLVANHRVVEVRKLNVKADVYNGTVDDTHRYFVMTGDNDAILSANCGEQPLISYESCNLGSINLEKFVAHELDMNHPGRKSMKVINWTKLRHTIHDATHFLDNVITQNIYPIPELKEMADKTRKIGLGVMGFARMLFLLEIPYGSPEALALAKQLMSFIDYESKVMSIELAKNRGQFPGRNGYEAESNAIYQRMFTERHEEPGKHPSCDYLQLFADVVKYGIRNSNTTTVAPTGTLSLFADTSGGCEPVFALAFKRWQAGLSMVDKDGVFYKFIKNYHQADLGDLEELLQRIDENHGSVVGLGLPQDIEVIFRTAHDITPQQHVLTQAAFQAFNDSATSKTINFPEEATVEDVEQAYRLAYTSGCKGITVYRNNSRQFQPLSVSKEKSVESNIVTEEKPSIRTRPEVLYGSTKKIDTAEGRVYVTINNDDFGPREVVANVGRSGGTLFALTEAIGRLISLALQYNVPVLELAKQLVGIRSGTPYGFGPNQVLSIPDAIGKALLKAPTSHTVLEDPKYGNFKADPVVQMGRSPECTKCGGTLYYSEGCFTCQGCGDSGCS